MTKKIGIEKKENNKSFGFVLPGISLTDTPRKFPWDKPPRLNTPDEALDYVTEMLEDPPVIVSFLRNTPSTFDILSSLVTLFHSLTLAVAPLVPPVIISLNWKLPTASLEVGTTPKFIATSIVKAGWAGNLWNPDVAELIKFPVGALVTIIGMEADVDIDYVDEKEEELPLKEAKLALSKKNKKDKDMEEKEEVVEQFKGIMARS